MNDFKEKLIKKIQSGEIDMKPKWHFVLKTILLISGIVLSALLAIYLLSFIFFTLHRSGLIFAPGYGMRGLGIFITASPWLLIVLAIIFLTTLYILVKKYSFSYKRPLLYSMIGVLFLVSLASFALERTQMHDRIQSFAEKTNLPGISPFYRSTLGQTPEGVTLGTIEEITDTGFVITNNEGKKITIITDSKTRQKPGSSYSKGDQLLIYGKKSSEDTINAYGIRKVDDGFKRGMQTQNQEGQLIKPFNNRADGPIRQQGVH